MELIRVSQVGEQQSSSNNTTTTNDNNKIIIFTHLMLSILFYFALLHCHHLIHCVFPCLLTAHLPPLGFKPGTELCVSFHCSIPSGYNSGLSRPSTAIYDNILK